MYTRIYIYTHININVHECIYTQNLVGAAEALRAVDTLCTLMPDMKECDAYVKEPYIKRALYFHHIAICFRKRALHTRDLPRIARQKECDAYVKNTYVLLIRSR